MDVYEYLAGERERYVGWYRGVLREKRETGEACVAEVWVRPNVPAGEPRPVQDLCVDIMMGGAEKPQMMMVAGESVEGGLMGTMEVGKVMAKVYALRWEVLPVWVRHADPDWGRLENWKKKWMDEERVANETMGGLCGIVHYVGVPTAEGGGHLFVMDFGSAPVEALKELLVVLVEMGASGIELGRSDGSDLPGEILEALKERELSMKTVYGVVARMYAMDEGVVKVEHAGGDQMKVYSKGEKDARRFFLGNLHRILLRVGPEARPRAVWQFLRGQRESKDLMEVKDLSQIRVVIKDDLFLANIREQMPGMKGMLMEKLVADLWTVGVWDSPNGMRFATAEEPKKYGMNEAEMMERGRRNNLREKAAAEWSKHGKLWVSQTKDCYDASVILDEEWVKEASGKVKGELLVCVPARHVVLVGGAGDARVVGEMRSAAQKVEEGGDHLISGTILVRRGERWEKMEETTSRKESGEVKEKKPWWKIW